MDLPLRGIRVLDLSRYLPGPFATQIMADFGAEVIKVEAPGGGELGRSLPPLLNGESTRYYSVNRNKQSIILNLKTPGGQEAFKRLAAKSDVIMDQFRPGVMDKLGLGHEELRQINPALIYCAITGYGLSGPLRDAAGHDINYLSLAGFTGLSGAYNCQPAICGSQIADIAGGGLYSVIAVLMAVAQRHKTGLGQHCDVAMFDASLSMMAYAIGEWCGLDKLPGMGDELLTGGYAFYQVYATKDGKYVSLGALEEKFYREFCRKIDRLDLYEKHWDKHSQRDIIKEISLIMQEKTRDEWTAFFADSDICFTPVLELDEVCEHPQVKARDMIYNIEDFAGSGQTLNLTGIPIKLSATPGKVEPKFAKPGEDTREILASLGGYTDQEIIKLKNDGVIQFP